MNLLTPTFVYYQTESPSVRSESAEQLKEQTDTQFLYFQDISVSCINQITAVEISDKYKELKGVENIELGKLRIWIVVLNDAFDFQSLNLNTFRDDVKKAIGIRHIEISCLILSNCTLTISSPIIEPLNKAKKQKWINYAVLLNNNNLSWIRSGGQMLTSDNLLFNYGLKLIERLHYTNCFLGDLVDTFNNIGYDKYLLTIGSSILPQDLIVEKREEKETYQLGAVFIEQNRIFWSVVNKFLKEKTQKRQKEEINNSELDRLFSEIFNIINTNNQKNKEKQDKNLDKENNHQKDKSNFFKALYSNLNLENSYISPYINNFKLQDYIPLIEELFTNQLCDFIQFLDSNLSDKRLLIKRKSAFLEKIKNKRLFVYPNNDNKVNEIRSAQFVLKQAEPPVNKQIKEWILETDFDDDEKDGASIMDRFRKDIGQIRIGKRTRGLINSKKMEETDNRNFVKFFINRIIKEQERHIINNIRNKDLSVLLKATENKSANREDIRTMLSALSNLKTIMSDNRKFNDKIFKTELETKLKAAFDTMQASPQFNQCLSLMVEIFITAHHAAVINTREEIKIRFIPETEPFFCCSSALENTNRIKQFVFTNQGIPQNGNELLEYVETNLFTNESMSIYGPWTEAECLEV